MISAGRIIWNAQRFGLTPSKLGQRLIPDRALPRLVLISIPKSGTHLIERALCLHPRIYRPIYPTLTRQNLGQYGGLPTLLARLGPGQLLVSHLPYSDTILEQLNDRGIRALFAVRDPRDILVSNAYYIAAQPRHPLYAHYTSCPELRDRIRLGIEGLPGQPETGIRARLEAFAPWADHLPVIRFEELAPSGGPGDGLSSAVTGLFGAAGIALAQPTAKHIAARLHSTASPTFRKGRAGQWREAFDPELKQLYRDQVSPLAAKLGYP